MDENFLMKFVGKDIGVIPFGGSMNSGVRGRVSSVDGVILRLLGDDDESMYIDIDGIMAVIPYEAIQDED